MATHGKITIAKVKRITDRAVRCFLRVAFPARRRGIATLFGVVAAVFSLAGAEALAQTGPTTADVTVVPASVTEGSGITINVTLDNPLPAAGTLSWMLTPGVVNPVTVSSDFAAASGTVAVTPANGTRITFTITPEDDDRIEYTEAAVIAITGADWTGGNASFSSGNSATFDVTDNATNVLNVRFLRTSATYAASGRTTVDVPVTATPADSEKTIILERPVTVLARASSPGSFTAEDGTHFDGFDDQVVTFAVGTKITSGDPAEGAVKVVLLGSTEAVSLQVGLSNNDPAVNLQGGSFLLSAGPAPTVSLAADPMNGLDAAEVVSGNPLNVAGVVLSLTNGQGSAPVIEFTLAGATATAVLTGNNINQRDVDISHFGRVEINQDGTGGSISNPGFPLTITFTPLRDSDNISERFTFTIDSITFPGIIGADIAGGDIAGNGQTITITDVDPAGGICGRTPAVQTAILGRIVGVSQCQNVTEDNLRNINGELNLSGQGIFSLEATDFAGLFGLETLRLNNNVLTRLHSSQFSDLSSLTTLVLTDNIFTARSATFSGGLPAGIFDDVLDTLGNVIERPGSDGFRIDDGVRAAHFVCGRTPAVRDAIVAAITEESDCLRVTTALLASIDDTLPVISLADSPRVNDFDGLDSLTGLTLAGAFERLNVGTLDSLLDTLTALELPDAVTSSFAFDTEPPNNTNVNPEGNTRLTVTLDKPASVAIRLPYTAAYEGGAANAQFTGQNGALIFPTGSLSRFFTVAALADVPATGSAITITLGTPELGTVSGGNFRPFSRPGTAEQKADVLSEIIRDGSDSTRRLTTPPYPDVITGFAKEPEDGQLPDLIEGNAVLYGVTLNRPALIDTNITYTITGDTGAVDANDFTGDDNADGDGNILTGMITVSAGQVVGVLVLQAAADGVVEGSENFTITLTAPEGLTLAEGVGTLANTIIDRDSAARIRSVMAASPEVIEGESAIVVTVTLENGNGDIATTAVETTLSYTITDDTGAVDANDFTGPAAPVLDEGILTGTITVNAGQNTGILVLDTRTDNLVEGKAGFVPNGESMTFTFLPSTMPDPSAAYHIAANPTHANNQAEVTILDPPPERITSIDVANEEVGEDGRIAMTVVLERPTLTEATITYDVGGTPGADDGAESGDYSTPLPTATIPAGMADATFFVPLNNDNRVENTESGRITITEISWRSGETVNGITLPGGSIDLTADVNSAIPGVQLQKPRSSFPLGELKPCSRLTADATAEELAERCLSPFADFTITDNDHIIVSLANSYSTTDYSGSPFSFQVNAVPSPNNAAVILEHDIVVHVSTQNGTAQGTTLETSLDNDYTIRNNAVVTFAASDPLAASSFDSNEISIPIRNDSDSAEFFTLQLSLVSPTGSGAEISRENFRADVHIIPEPSANYEGLAPDPITLIEGGSSFTRPLVISHPPDAAATVSFSFTGTEPGNPDRPLSTGIISTDENAKIRMVVTTVDGTNITTTINEAQKTGSFVIPAGTARANITFSANQDDNTLEETITFTVTGIEFPAQTNPNLDLPGDLLPLNFQIDERVCGPAATLTVSSISVVNQNENDDSLGMITETEFPSRGVGVQVMLDPSGDRTTIHYEIEGTSTTSPTITFPAERADVHDPNDDGDADSFTGRLTFVNSDLFRQATGVIPVTAAADNLVEGYESVSAVVTRVEDSCNDVVFGEAFSSRASRTRTLTIVDADTASATVQITGALSEAGGAATARVELDTPLAANADFTLVSEESADVGESNNDVTLFGNTVSIRAGETTSGPITIAAADDAIADAGETFKIKIGAAAYSQRQVAISNLVTLGDSGDIPIHDNDSNVIQLSGDLDEDSEVDVTVRLPGTAPTQRTLTYTLAPTGSNPAAAADINGGFGSRSITVPAGEGEASFTIGAANDDFIELPETFTLTIENGVFGFPAGSGLSREITIRDSDKVNVRFTQSSYRVPENIANGTFPVQLYVSGNNDNLTFPQGASISIPISLASADGTAVSTPPDLADFTSFNSTVLTITNDSLPYNITPRQPPVDAAINNNTIIHNSDRNDAQQEAFTLNLAVSDSRIALGGNNPATVTIVDSNASMPMEITSITVDDDTITEGEQATITIMLDEPVPDGQPAVINFTTAGDATTPGDYTLVDANGSDITSVGSVSISDGDRAHIVVMAVDDNVPEFVEEGNRFNRTLNIEENLTITITIPGGSPLSFNLAEGLENIPITITDNDTPILDSIVTKDGREGENLEFTFSLKAPVPAGSEATVAFSIFNHPSWDVLGPNRELDLDDSDLNEDGDYTAIIPAGQSAITKRILVKNDGYLEPEESGTIVVSALSFTEPDSLPTIPTTHYSAGPEEAFNLIDGESFTATMVSQEVIEGSGGVSVGRPNIEVQLISTSRNEDGEFENILVQRDVVLRFHSSLRPGAGAISLPGDDTVAAERDDFFVRNPDLPRGEGDAFEDYDVIGTIGRVCIATDPPESADVDTRACPATIITRIDSDDFANNDRFILYETDDLEEENEEFLMSVSFLEGAEDPAVTLGEPATITILNDDGPLEVALFDIALTESRDPIGETTDPFVDNEIDEAKEKRFRIRLNRAVRADDLAFGSTTIEIPFRISGQDITEGDFQIVNRNAGTVDGDAIGRLNLDPAKPFEGSFAFPRGITESSFSIRALNDSIYEDTETLDIRLELADERCLNIPDVICTVDSTGLVPGATVTLSTNVPTGRTGVQILDNDTPSATITIESADPANPVEDTDAFATIVEDGAPNEGGTATDGTATISLGLEGLPVSDSEVTLAFADISPRPGGYDAADHNPADGEDDYEIDIYVLAGAGRERVMISANQIGDGTIRFPITRTVRVNGGGDEVVIDNGVADVEVVISAVDNNADATHEAIGISLVSVTGTVGGRADTILITSDLSEITPGVRVPVAAPDPVRLDIIDTDLPTDIVSIGLESVGADDLAEGLAADRVTPIALSVTLTLNEDVPAGATGTASYVIEADPDALDPTEQNTGGINDYGVLPVSTILGGNSAVTFEIPINDDNRVENIEGGRIQFTGFTWSDNGNELGSIDFTDVNSSIDGIQFQNSAVADLCADAVTLDEIDARCVNAFADFTIADNDAVIVGVTEETEQVIAREGTNATVTVAMTPNVSPVVDTFILERDITVNLATADGTNANAALNAEEPGDYAELNADITFPAAPDDAVESLTRDESITIKDDDLEEDSEDFTATLTIATDSTDSATIEQVTEDGNTRPRDTATITILDTDSVTAAVITPDNATEQDDEDPGSFTISFTNAPNLPASVVYTIADSYTTDGDNFTLSAGAGITDFVAVAGTFTMDANTDGVLVVEGPHDDDIYDETVTLTLTSVTFTGAPDSTTIRNETASLTINDDDPLVISLPAAVQLTEAASNTNANKVALELSGGLMIGARNSDPASVTLTPTPTNPPQAVLAEDLFDTSQGVRIITIATTLRDAAEGAAFNTPTTLDVLIAVEDDSSDEDDEQFILTLSNPTGPLSANVAVGDSGRDTSTATIIDDDDGPTNVPADPPDNPEGEDGITDLMVSDAPEADEKATATIELNRPIPTGGIMQVSYTLTPDMNASFQAEDGVDYPTGEQTVDLTFISGTTYTFPVAIIDDDITENNEGVSLTVNTIRWTATDGTDSFTPAGDEEHRSDTFTIIDNDRVTIGFAETAIRIEEGGNANITVSVLDGTLAPNRNAVVSLSAGNSNPVSATPDDYPAISMELTFSANDLSEPVNIAIPMDAEPDEVDETFALSLTTADTNITLAPAVATVTIADTTRVISEVEATPSRVNEGDDLTVTLTLNANALANATFQYTITGDVVAEDFTSGSLTGEVIVRSGSAVQTLTLAIASDGVMESDEGMTITFAASSSPALNEPGHVLAGTNNSATAIIVSVTPTITIDIDDDNDPAVRTSNITEDKSIYVTLDLGAIGAVSERSQVIYSIESTELADNDYGLIPTDSTVPDVFIEAEQTDITFFIPVANDNRVENSESGRVVITRIGSIDVAAEAAFTIVDNDDVNVTISKAQAEGLPLNSVSERAASFPAIIELTPNVNVSGEFASTEFTLERDVMVSFKTVDGTALAKTRVGGVTVENDYAGPTAAAETFTFTAVGPNTTDGEGSCPPDQDFLCNRRIDIFEDTIVENDETFNVTASILNPNPSVSPGPPAVKTVTIIDNDGATAISTVSASSVTEGENVVVSITPNGDLPVGTMTVEYIFTPGTAVAEDFSPSLAGGVTRTLTATGIDDDGDSNTEPEDSDGLTRVFTFGIPTNDDSIVENLESGTIAVTSVKHNARAASITLPASPDNSSDFSITDNDTTTVSISPTTDSESEETGEGDDNMVTYTISAVADLERDVNVNVTINDDTAIRVPDNDYTATVNSTNSTNYTGTAISINLNAAEANRQVVITVNDDDIDELDESLTISVARIAGQPVSDTDPLPTATQTIIDDDNGPTGITALTVANAPEENAGTTATITLNNPVPAGRMVTYTLAPGASPQAGATDYPNPPNPPNPPNLPQQPVVLTATGTPNQYTFPVAINNDDITEDNEGVSLTVNSITWTAPNGGTATFTVTEDEAERSAAFVINDDDAVTIGLSSGGYTFAEGEAMPQVMVQVTGVVEATGLQAILTSTPGSATSNAPADYTALGGQAVLIPAGTYANTPIAVDLAIADDNAVENTERFTLALTAPHAQVNVTGTAAANVDITDNDNVMASVSVSPESVAENADVIATVTLEIASGAAFTLERAVIVGLSTADGTATEGADYVRLAQDITFAAAPTALAAAAMTQDRTIDIIDNTIEELDETFTVTATLGTATNDATVTIIDDDGASTINSVVAADDAPEGAGIVVTITLNDSLPAGEVTVEYTIGGTTAIDDDEVEDEDFTIIDPANTAIVDLNAASNTLTFNILTYNDTRIENTEFGTLTITRITHGGRPTMPITAATPTTGSVSDGFSIADNDNAVFTITSTMPMANENIGNVGEDGNVAFTIGTTDVLERSVTVRVFTRAAGDTATGGTSDDTDRDYTSLDTSLTFNAANAPPTQSVMVGIYNDTIDEVDEETFTISLAASDENQPIATPFPTATQIIVDDDDGPTGITSLSVKDVTEGITEADTATIVLNNPIPTGSAMQVIYNLAGSGDAPAEDGADYPGGTQTVDLTLSQGEGIAANTYTFPVATSTDNLIEGDEDARLEVDVISWESIDATSSFTAPDAVGSRDTFTIEDDDNLSVALAAARLSVGEETGIGAILSVGGGDLVAPADVVVTTVVSGTAVDTDFTTVGAIDVTIPIDDYSTPKTINVNLNINDDEIVENEETFNLTLAENPDDPRVVLDGLNGRTTATAAIEDDDKAVFTIVPVTPRANENIGPVGEDGNVAFTIGTTDVLERSVTVRVFTRAAGDTATGGTRDDTDRDYTSLDTSLTFTAANAPNAPPTQSVMVGIYNDTIDEVDEETFTISLAASDENQPTSPDFPNTLATATQTIIDNDVSTVRITPTNGTDAVDDAADISGAFAITIFGAPSAVATVTYAVSSNNGSVRGANANYRLVAEAGSNIPSASLTNTTFTITDASMSSTLTVPSSDADIYDETITLTISSVTFADNPHANITGATASGPLIIDDLDTLTISMADSTAIITEATDDTDQITLTLTPTPNTLTTGRGDATVMLTPMASGAVQADPAADLTGTSQAVRPITITPANTATGADPLTVDIAVHADDLVEDAETFTLTLSAPAGPEDLSNPTGPEDNVRLGTPAATIVTIADNNEAQVTVTGTGNTVVDNALRTITVQEDIGNLTINVGVRNAAKLRRNIAVNLATADGTATAGEDYTAVVTPLTEVVTPLTFEPPNPTPAPAQPFSVRIVDDEIMNADRTFTITLTSSDPVMRPLPGPYTVTIVNDDLPSIGFGTADVMTTSIPTPENVVGGELEVQILAEAGSVFLNPVTVSVQSMDGTALNVMEGEGDYDTVSQTLTFNSDIQTHTQTITIEINDDTFDEVNETFTLALSSTSDSVKTGDDATVTIEDDDDATATLEATTNTTTEGNAGDTPTPGVFTLALTDPPNAAAVVSYRLVGEGVKYDAVIAVGGEELEPPGALGAPDKSFPIAAGTTSVDINITPKPDADIYDETVTMVVTRIVFADNAHANIEDDRTASLTINDNETLMVQFSAAAQTVSEINGTGAMLSVRGGQVLPGRLPVVTVTPTIPGGAAPRAVNGDFSGAGPAALTVTVPAANYTNARDIAVTTAAGMNINLEDDAIAEGNEGFAFDAILIAATTPSDANVAVGTQATATGIITDNDTATIQFSDTTLTTAEGDITFNAEVEIIGAALERAVEVQVQSMDGTAIAGMDYNTVNSGTLTFDSNNTSRTFPITILNDDVAEGNTAETFTLALSFVSGETTAVSLGGPASVAIADNDIPGLTINPRELTIDEGDERTWAVNLNTDPAGPVVINISRASGDTDITVVPATARLSFTGGVGGNWATPQNVRVMAIEDDDNTDDMATFAHAVTGYGDVNGTGDDVDVTATDNEATQIDSIAISPVAATISEQGETSVEVTVTLDGFAPMADIDIDYAITDNHADEFTADDIRNDTVTSSALNGTFTIATGSNSGSIIITAVDDFDDEDDQVFVLTLNSSDVTLPGALDNTVDITITDNDTAATGILSVTAVPDSIPEDGGETTITIILNGMALQAGGITLHYDIARSTESDDITHHDFSSHEALMNHEIIFPQGSDRASFTITTAADSDMETPDQGEEQFFVTVTDTAPGGSGQNFSEKSSNHVTITELDVEIVADELESLSLIVAMEEVRLTRQLVRQRIESPFFGQPEDASPTMRVTLPDNPQNMDDMIDGLGLGATGITDSGWHYGMYARGQRSNLDGTPTVNGNVIDYDGNATGIGGGMEWSNGIGLIGLAANYVITDLALSAVDANISRYREKVILTAPYFSVKHGRVAKYWGMLAAGVGDAEATLNHSTTDSANVQVGFVAGGADITLINQGDEEIVFGLSGLGVRKEVEQFNFGAAGTIPKTTVDTVQGRGELTWFRNIVVGDELLRPHIGIASLHDFGDVISDDRHGLETRAGITYAKGDLQVGMEVTSEFLRKDREQWAFTGGMSWDARLNGRGLRLGLNTAHTAPIGGGIAATGGSGGVDQSWEVSLEGEYGLSAPLLHRSGLLTPFAGVTEREDERELSGGMRFLIGNGIGVDFETLRRSYQDEEDFSEHRVGLRGRWKF